MDIKALRTMSVEQLQEEVGNLKKELAQIKFDLKVGQLNNFNLVKDKKKDIARVLTIINERKKVSGQKQKAGQSEEKV